MNLGEELNDFRTGARELRRFGLLVGSVFALLAVWFWYRERSFWPWLAAPAVPLIGLALVYPKSLRVPYLGWMSLALVLGVVVSTIILVLFFYLVVTPIGLIARLAGKDFLNLKWKGPADTYWITREPATVQPADYERQF